jgi:anion-transporting  ArsA/GET3 family ATPase
MTPTPRLDVDALVDDRETRIIVCCGSGGVGKTTTAAALALRAAERGRSVVVLTIDPARRLAQSMGIEALDNTPRPVVGLQGDPEHEPGQLAATMLDMKSTFDEVVMSQASPEKARLILENPFYIALSSSFAGTQEYMAMEKLGQLHAQAVAEGTYDLIVVDTPPSRSALDFLDAPERLSSFLDGRFIRLLMAPARGPARLFTSGLGVVTHVLTTIIGSHVLQDMQTFVAALDTLFGGFRQRAERTYALLQAPGTAFVVVATPERDALDEAAYFLTRLREEHMPLSGVVVNRMTELPTSGMPAAGLTDDQASRAAADLDLHEEESASLAAALLRLYADRLANARTQTRSRDGFSARHPGVPMVSVPALPTDIHDLDGLRLIGELLANHKAELPSG